MSSSYGVQWGAFLVDTQPLEMQGSRCGMCHYCFADLNKPDRKIDLPSILNRLKNYRDRKDYASKLMQWGYPTTISNHVDPFGSVNARYFLPIMEMMSGLGLPIKVQTKGGKNAWKALEFLPKTGWYITITTDDADIAKLQEPGAPPPEERLGLAAELISRGHAVTIAVNPLVPEWIPDPERLIKLIAATGVRGAWIQPLHFSHKQIARLTSRGKSAIGEDLIKRVTNKRTLDPKDEQFYCSVLRMATENGLHLAYVGNGDYSEYHEAYHEIFARTFPVLQDWINWCHTFKEPFDYVTFDEFCEVLTPWLPEGKLPIKDHLAATNRFDMFKGMGFDIPPARMTYGELLRWYWERKDFKASAINAACFSLPVVKGQDPEGDPVLDENGIPKLVFYPGALSEGCEPDAQPYPGKYDGHLAPFRMWMDG